jgi:hypothetical protein
LKYVFVNRLGIGSPQIRKLFVAEYGIFARPIAVTGQKVKAGGKVFQYLPESCFEIVSAVAAQHDQVLEAEAVLQAATKKQLSVPLHRLLSALDERFRALPSDLSTEDESAIVAHCETVREIFANAFNPEDDRRRVEQIIAHIREIQAMTDLDERTKRLLVARLESQIAQL